MNATGLNIIKTLGCMTAVTFYTIYNTWDRYDYDYHWILGFLTFISTIATPLFFVVSGYLDGQSRHGSHWQLGKIKSLMEERKSLYEKYADITVNVTGSTVGAVTEKICSLLEEE